MALRLSDCLVRDGTLPTDVVRAATARQAVYGGTLDTALLELSALDESTLWTALAEATGAPIPDATLFENPDPAAATLFDLAWSRRCRAVPVGQRDGSLQLCCSEPVDVAQLDAARTTLGLTFELYVVPEVRLAAARQAVYGEPMPPRLLRVLARLLGAQPVRRWFRAMEPAAPTAAVPEALAAAPASSATSVFAPGELEEGELAEAEFDVPVNTYTTEPADILESRASRAARAAASNEVALALAGPASPPETAMAVEGDPAAREPAHAHRTAVARDDGRRQGGPAVPRRRRRRVRGAAGGAARAAHAARSPARARARQQAARRAQGPRRARRPRGGRAGRAA